MKKIILAYARRENDDDYTPPLGLGYISSYLKKFYKNEIEIKIITDNYKKNIDNINPDIVGISSITKNLYIAKEISEYCKQKNIFNVIGGCHITALPYSLFKSADFGVIGEGEQTFLDIVNNIDKKDIKGTVYWQNEKLIMNEERELIKDLDTIPFPIRSFKADSMGIMSSRGCPYNCIFCSNPVFWKNKVRFHSAEYVVNEIKHLIKKYNPPYIQFCDSLFTINKNRLERIVELIEKEMIKTDFIISARADLITEDIMKILKRMNVIEICIGFESGSQDILNYLKKGTSLEDNKRAIEIIKKYKIKVTGHFIIGSPIETKKTILETFDFIKKNEINTANLFTLTPYPSTSLWNHSVEKGIVSNNMDWTILNRAYDPKNPNELISLCDNLSKQEIADYYTQFLHFNKIKKTKQLIKNAVLHPKRIIPFIKKIIAS